MSYNHTKYLKYKRKKQLLHQKQISITLEEDWPKNFQEVKGERRLLFEDQLKTHFQKKKKLSDSINSETTTIII